MKLKKSVAGFTAADAALRAGGSRLPWYSRSVDSTYLTGKRVFLMAPIHHHYEKKGWPEPRIIVRFWIISLILVLSIPALRENKKKS